MYDWLRCNSYLALGIGAIVVIAIAGFVLWCILYFMGKDDDNK